MKKYYDTDHYPKVGGDTESDSISKKKLIELIAKLIEGATDKHLQTMTGDEHMTDVTPEYWSGYIVGCAAIRDYITRF